MRWKVIKEYPNYSISDAGIVKRNVYTRIDKIGRKTVVKEMILKQYTDANQAEIYITGRKGSNISQCANGKFKQVYGYKWRWA